MPKVTGPLFSSEAHGTLKKVLTFSKRKTGQQVRFQRSAKDKLTEARAEVRENFLNAVSAWNELGEEEKAEWNEKGAAQKLTGYNLFLKENIGGTPPPPPPPPYGPELVINGGFDGNANGWTLTGGFYYDNGKITTISGGNPWAEQPWPLEQNKIYKIEFDLINFQKYTGDGRVTLELNGESYHWYAPNGNSHYFNEILITGSSGPSSNGFSFQANYTPKPDGSVDNFSIKEKLT